MRRVDRCGIDERFLPIIVVCAVTCAVVCGVFVAGGTRAMALDDAEPESAYTHVWREEILVSGEAGSTRKTIALSDVELSWSEDSFYGSVAYQDILGLVGPNGSATSRSSDIRLNLDGVSLEGGSSAGGSFTGTVAIIERTAEDLEQASSPEMLAVSAGVFTSYEVAGHWRASLTGEIAAGELLFERVAVLVGDDDVLPSRFNRVSLADPDGNGLAQTFIVGVSGLPNEEKFESAEAAENEPESTAETRASIWEYIARGISGGSGESEVVVPANASDRARALKESRPARATTLSDSAVAIDVDITGSYLDAKNRAAGLVSGSGPRVDGAVAACAAVQAARAGVPGRAAITPDEDAGLVYVERIREQLASLTSVQGVADVAGTISLVRPGADASTVARLKVLSVVVEAVVGDAYGTVLAPTYVASEEVGSRDVPRRGAAAAAVLVAADSPAAPVSHLQVDAFARVPELDAVSGPDGDRLPNRVLARHGSGSGGVRSGLAWEGSEGAERIAPAGWIAYRRSDGAVFWRAGNAGSVALTDASLIGWGWSLNRAALVDATRCGRVLQFYDTE